MRRSKVESRQLVAGTALIVGFFGLLFIGYLKPHLFHSTKTVWATFDNVATLTSTDRDVRVGGATVGHVGKVERSGDRARIQLVLDQDDIRIARDATADLRPHLAFEGSSFIDLHPGSASAPEIDGQTGIPANHTRNYVSLDKVLRVANRDTRTALKGDLAKLGDSLAAPQQQDLQKTIKSLPQLYPRLATAARATRGVNGDELSGAISGLARTVRDVSTREADFQPGLRDAGIALNALKSGTSLETSLAALPSTLNELHAGGAQLRGIVDKLKPFATDVQPALRALVPAQRKVRPLLVRLAPVLRSARPVVSDARVALDSLGNASPVTRRVLRNLNPIYEPLNDRVVPALFEKTRLGATVYDQLIRGFATGYDSAIAPVVNKDQSLGMGVGHGFTFNATAGDVPLNGFPIGCANIPTPVRTAVADLNLCGGP